MKQISRKRRQFIIFLIDVLILFLSIPLTLILRKFQIPSLISIFEHWITFLPIIIFWELLMYGAGMYALEKPFKGTSVVLKMSLIASISLLIGFTLFYLLLVNTITPKTVLFIYSFLSFSLLVLWRHLYNYFFGMRKKHPRLVFLGNNDTVTTLIKEMQRFSYLSFTPIAVYDADTPLKNFSDAPYFSNSSEFIEFLSNNSIDYCILASEKEYPLEIRQYLFSLLERGVVFFNLPDFFEIVTRKIPIGSINDTWLLSNLDASPRPLFNFLKRFFDLAISSVILICTAVFWPIIALVIKIESKGPVFFRQIRLGRGNKPFSILKFRTMRVEDNSFNPTGKNDTRITPLGNFLRKSRIDEIPQIINIFRGDMTFIGPRPERPELAVDLEKSIPYYKQRLIVKPGITGWDQVSGEYHSPSVEDTYKKLQFDLYYIKNRSVFLDISILFKTITTVLKRSGR